MKFLIQGAATIPEPMHNVRQEPSDYIGDDPENVFQCKYKIFFTFLKIKILFLKRKQRACPHP